MSDSRKGDRIVVGRQAVLETLRHKHAQIDELYLIKGKEYGEVKELLDLAETHGVKKIFTSPDALDKLSMQTNHQGVALQLTHREYSTTDLVLQSTADEERSIILALDEIYDPQNLGSILRTAECFGVSAVMWSKNRGVGITPVVTKVSAGASQLVPLIQISNLHRELEVFKKNGFWILVADGGEDATPLHSFDYPDKVVLVLGSEGKGVQPLIKKGADATLKIPMEGVISSLNVAQAGAVFLSSWLR